MHPILHSHPFPPSPTQFHTHPPTHPLPLTLTPSQPPTLTPEGLARLPPGAEPPVEEKPVTLREVREKLRQRKTPHPAYRKRREAEKEDGEEEDEEEEKEEETEQGYTLIHSTCITVVS